MDIFDIIARIGGTIALRPYFAGFLLAYFLACSLHLGVKRALLFAVAGYIVAWASEYSSIHNGFPYGLYYYIPTTKDVELWMLGVPFMDSMSFVFLSYASYSMALLVTSPWIRCRGGIYPLESRKIRHSLKVRILGALFCVGLDVIIDPVALRGGKWFLGQIYGYAERGIYFGVPLSNFFGWFIVAFCLIYLLQLIDRGLSAMKVKDAYGARYFPRYLPGPGLYLAIMIFNLSVTLMVGEFALLGSGFLFAVLPLLLGIVLVRSRLAKQSFDEALKAHIEDFPGVVMPAMGGPGRDQMIIKRQTRRSAPG